MVCHVTRINQNASWCWICWQYLAGDLCPKKVCCLFFSVSSPVASWLSSLVLSSSGRDSRCGWDGSIANIESSTSLSQSARSECSASGDSKWSKSSSNEFVLTLLFRRLVTRDEPFSLSFSAISGVRKISDSCFFTFGCGDLLTILSLTRLRSVRDSVCAWSWIACAGNESPNYNGKFTH